MMIKYSAGTFSVIWLLLVATSALAESTADHTKYSELDRAFATAPDVTKACLGCHTEAAKQIHKTKHWTWEFLNPENKQRLGKRNVLNNFCITPQSNFSYCAACHVGYGWKDENFDFTAEDKVDCLVCHDTTGGYSKPPGKAGYPADYVNLTNVAQNVGKTSRDTCGACHFYGGGGDGVKHGDMDSTLAVPDYELDVHMDALGEDFNCSTCHKGLNHDVVGSRYTPTAVDTEGQQIRSRQEPSNGATCQSCHDIRPHASKDEKLNDHTTRLACQTCHIPTIARGDVATKLTWDWSTAGKHTPDGKAIVEKDEKGHVVYHGKKGNFTYGSNIPPEYTWFNGEVIYTLLEDKLDTSKDVVPINYFSGSAEDGKSRIWPIKVFRGKQPYDPINKTLVVPHTAGDDDTAYWKNFDWNKSITEGMRIAGRPFSGEIEFIKTEMIWPITHTVAPKENALGCEDCHSKNGRLHLIQGVYIPGRDTSEWLDKLGWSLALMALIGVIGHGALRIFTNGKK